MRPLVTRTPRWHPRLLLIAATSAVLTLAATGCAVMRDQQSVGSYVDDATLTTRVKAKFADDATVSAITISVETFKGVVQLSGVANTQSEKDIAGRLARETSGVIGVRNDIVVRG